MSTEEKPLIYTSAGTLAGAWESDNQLAVFKGIPYARPPVGLLRWRAPQPAEAWKGTRDATAFGPIAWQHGGRFDRFIPALIDGQGFGLFKRTAIKTLIRFAPKRPQNEDCLFLNVRTPDPTPEAKLPVMVWIHGGDHQIGSGSDPLYTSNSLAKKGVVYVNINYRIGIMGFFAHPQLSEEADNYSCNFGTLDQIAALKWVQQNISHFGGDPDNVTIFGESAGGESVSHLLVSPLARGLFHRAIMQSPANGRPLMHLAQRFLDYLSGEEQGDLFAQGLGISGPDSLTQLRQRSAAEIYQQVMLDDKHGAFYPQVDGDVLPQSPFAAFHHGNQSNVPIIIGTNADEGSLLHDIFPTPLVEHVSRPMVKDQLPDFVYEQFPDEIEQLLALYPALERRESNIERAFYGDSMFGAKARFLAGAAAKNGQPAYLYHFTRVPPSPRQTAGAFHAAELPFIFKSQSPIFPMSEQDIALSDAMIDYWTNFARTGDPNSGRQPTWQPFVDNQPEWMRLDPSEWGMKPVVLEEKYRLLNRRTLRHVALMTELERR